MSDVTKMTDAEKAAKWDSLMTLTGGRVEVLGNAMVSVASAVENMPSLLRRGADALERVRSDNSTLRTQLAECERECDAARAERERLRLALAGVMKFARPSRGVFCSTECLGQCSECKAMQAADAALAPQPEQPAPHNQAPKVSAPAAGGNA